eukprot:TRINITY_DN61491_c0_g1_i3.p1 TRINITY_DN61491_c0_g1~~TRINITY_DN61491_c0_g1_i3.p1  ORF type:complete len:350 (+),score=23.97 TRINITY_DN61491_c0_g1_i3:64-1050(+)
MNTEIEKIQKMALVASFWNFCETHKSNLVVSCGKLLRSASEMDVSRAFFVDSSTVVSLPAPNEMQSIRQHIERPEPDSLPRFRRLSFSPETICPTRMSVYELVGKLQLMPENEFHRASVIDQVTAPPPQPVKIVTNSLPPADPRSSITQVNQQQSPLPSSPMEQPPHPHPPPPSGPPPDTVDPRNPPPPPPPTESPNAAQQQCSPMSNLTLMTGPQSPLPNQIQANASPTSALQSLPTPTPSLPQEPPSTTFSQSSENYQHITLTPTSATTASTPVMVPASPEDTFSTGAVPPPHAPPQGLQVSPPPGKQSPSAEFKMPDADAWGAAQ